MNTRVDIIRQPSFDDSGINPFRNTLHMPWHQWLKVAIMSVTVFPIRLVALTSITGAIMLLSSIASITAPAETWNHPLVGWRKQYRGMIRKLGRFAFRIVGFHNIKVIGNRAERHEAMILVVAPHSTFFDMVVYSLRGPLSPISKASNKNIPGVGGLGQLNQTLFVDRKDEHDRMKIREMIQERANPSHDLPQIALFPEGTCTNRTSLINFKAGAFAPGVPVQPVILRYPNKYDTVTWTMESYSLSKILWLNMCQINIKMVVEHLPVYYPNEKEKADPKLYADNVRKVMAKALDIPISEHSYEDCRLMMLAKDYNLPQTCGVIEFSKLRRKLDLDFDTATAMLKHYSKMCGKGEINYDEFSQYIGIPKSPILLKLFNMYDRNGSGKIEFREFIISMTLVAKPASTDETLKHGFEIFDRNNKGYVNLEDFHRIMSASFNMSLEECEKIFNQIDTNKNGQISFESLKRFSNKHPYYAKIFKIYQDFLQERFLE